MIRYIIVLALIITACQPSNRVFVEHQELSPQLEWIKEDVKEFTVPIDDITSSYNLSFSFRYLTGFDHDALEVRLTEISPTGKESVSYHTLYVKDEKGDYIGEYAYEIWDSEHLVEVDKKFGSGGTYTFIIEHAMPVDPLNQVMEIGVILDKL